MLVQQLSHNYVAYYDNVSRIRQWISDVLCRGVTGTRFSKRQFYSNDENIIYRFPRYIGLNGINVAIVKVSFLLILLIENLLLLDFKQRLNFLQDLI